MKLKKHLSNLLKVFICVAFIASAIEIHAQNGTTMTVSGTIVDAAGIPVIGAVVIDPANTSNGCISNVDGDFTMQAALVIGSINSLYLPNLKSIKLCCKKIM